MPSGGIGFKNETNIPIIVQGASVTNGMVRQGPPIVIAAGRLGYDGNLPPGPRIITIYDGTLPQRVLLQPTPIPFQGRDIVLSVVPAPNNRVSLK